MRRFGIALALAALIGCDGGTSEPEPVAPEDLRLAVTGGQWQADTVLSTLANITVLVSEDEDGELSIMAGDAFPVDALANAVAGEDVCWDIPNPDLFRIRPICATTDDAGQIIGEPVLGDVAADSLFLVAFAVREGGVQAVDTAWATAEPGAVETGGNDWTRAMAEGVGASWDSNFPLEDTIPHGENNYSDAHGNVIPYRFTATNYLTVLSDDIASDSSRMVQLDTAGLAAGDTATFTVLRGTGAALLRFLVTAHDSVYQGAFQPLARVTLTVQEVSP